MEYSKNVLSKLKKIDMNLSIFGYSIKSYWNRLAIDECEIFNNKTHKHSFYELHLCLRGESLFEIRGNNYLLEKGKYILCNRGETHQIKTMSDDFVKLVWGFDFTTENEQTKKEVNEYLKKQFFFDYDEETKELVDSIVVDLSEKKINYIEQIKLKMFLIFSKVINNMIKTPNEIEENDEEDPRMRIITTFIDDNISQGITVDALCHEFNMSDKQMSRLSKADHDVSIGKYIQIRRIERAKQLLKNTNKNLSEIADELCYSDEYAFGKSFKRIEGMSPIAYRKSFKL